MIFLDADGGVSIRLKRLAASGPGGLGCSWRLLGGSDGVRRPDEERAPISLLLLPIAGAATIDQIFRISVLKHKIEGGE